MKNQAQKWFILEILNGVVQPVPPPIDEVRVIRADTQQPRVISEATQEERIT